MEPEDMLQQYPLSPKKFVALTWEVEQLGLTEEQQFTLTTSRRTGLIELDVRVVPFLEWRSLVLLGMVPKERATYCRGSNWLSSTPATNTQQHVEWAADPECIAWGVVVMLRGEP